MINKKNNELVLRQIIREIINEMVNDVISNTKKNIMLKKIKIFKDIVNNKYPIVSFSHKMKLFDLSIKEFLREKMYYSKSVLKKTNQGKKIIKSLFELIKKKPKIFVNLKKFNHLNKERIICDYIAGMTDRYAINLYKKTK